MFGASEDVTSCVTKSTKNISCSKLVAIDCFDVWKILVHLTNSQIFDIYNVAALITFTQSSWTTIKSPAKTKALGTKLSTESFY